MSFTKCLSNTLSAVFAIIALLAVSTALISADVNAETETNADRLKLTIYYETLCPDSRRFVFNDLYPAMMENNWLQYTELEFVPYGKVRNWTNPETNEVNLFCQHGRTECELNALHACIVENNNVEEQLKLINCLMINYRRTIDQCGESTGIDVEAAKHCKATRDTSSILAKYGELTHAIDLSFVPSTAFDNIFNSNEQSDVFYSFDKTFCKHYKQKYNTTINGC